MISHHTTIKHNSNMERETLIENHPEIEETYSQRQHQVRPSNFVRIKTDDHIVFFRQLIDDFACLQPIVITPTLPDWAVETEKKMAVDITNALSGEQSAKYLKYLNQWNGELIKENENEKSNIL